jgi:hypothetical protein
MDRIAPIITTRRTITPDEFTAIVRGDLIPHLVEGPVVELLRKVGLGAFGDVVWSDAHRRGYLVLPIGSHHISTRDGLAWLWRWWCLIAERPEIVIGPMPNEALYQLRVDTSPAGVSMPFSVLGSLGKIWSEFGGVSGPWFVSRETVEVDGLDLESALGLATGILDLVNRGSGARLIKGQ